MKSAFIFAGQGAQEVGMGKDLYENFSSAAQVFDKADGILSFSVKDLCFNGPEEKLRETKYCQPSIFTMSIACYEAFKELYPSVTPIGTAGLSLGEFGALYASGVFSFENGLELLAKRAEFMQEACNNTNGTMASVLRANKDTVQEVAEKCEIDVANFNTPGQIVISGEKNKIQNAIKELKAKGVKKIIPLNVAGAYHSSLMETAEVNLEKEIYNYTFNLPQVPIAQNYTGNLTEKIGGIKQNIIKQVSNSVLWENCVNSIINELDADTFIEFGPGKVLTGLVKKINKNVNTFNINNIENLQNFEVS